MRERDANKRNIPIIAKVRSKRKSPERGVETGLRHLQMPRRGNSEIIFFFQNKLLNMQQKGGHSRVEMVNKKQHLQNLDPTPTLADLLFASHSLFVGTYYYDVCLLYFSGFDFSGKKFLYLPSTHFA